MRNPLRLFLLAVAVPALVAGPHAQELPKFEVATLKVSPPPTTASISIVLGAFQNGRFVFSNATLNDMVQYAFALPSKDLLIGLDWSDSIRFDVLASAPPDAPLALVRLMVQHLLRERLHLVTRTDQRPLRYAALVLDKSSPQLKPANGPSVNLIQIRGRIDHKRMPMSQLASLLSRFEQMLIVDRTGLNDVYEVHLEWAPDRGIAPGDPAAPPPDLPSLFAAVREQLGLRLESRRGPLDVVVIQNASRVPEPN